MTSTSITPRFYHHALTFCSYMDGAWDMFHQVKTAFGFCFLGCCRHKFSQGHVAVLKEARKLGTFLLVGIQSDETVNSMRGQNLPIMNLHERALGVLSCRYVDEVTAAATFVLHSLSTSSL